MSDALASYFNRRTHANAGGVATCHFAGTVATNCSPTTLTGTLCRHSSPSSAGSKPNSFRWTRASSAIFSVVSTHSRHRHSPAHTSNTGANALHVALVCSVVTLPTHIYSRTVNGLSLRWSGNVIGVRSRRCRCTTKGGCVRSQGPAQHKLLYLCYPA
jgi:hypothetical protein